MPGDSTADQNRVYDGYYTIHANDISFFSAAPTGPDAADGSRLILDAEGGGNKDGHLVLKATGSTVMLCDTASVAIRNTDSGQEVHIECDATGKITIHQGDLVKSPQIVLSPDGITMSVGLPGAGTQIAMTENSITLQCGPLAKIQMSMDGIKLVVADENSVELKATEVDVQGLSVKVTGQLQTEITGVQTKVSGSAMLQAQGAITMIG